MQSGVRQRNTPSRIYRKRAEKETEPMLPPRMCNIGNLNEIYRKTPCSPFDWLRINFTHR
jgi:hypothetical protein